MIRAVSIGFALLGFAFAPTCVLAGERAPYMDSVLYSGEQTTTAEFGGVSSSFDPFVAELAPADTTTGSTDSTTTAESAPSLHASETLASQPGSFGGTMLASLAVGAGLAYGGAVLAYSATGPHSGEWDGVGEALAGGMLGNAIGSAAGAHLANGGRGSLGTAVFTSMLTSILLPVSLFAGPAGWAAFSIGQAALVAAVERGTAKKKRERAAAEQSANPSPH